MQGICEPRAAVSKDDILSHKAQNSVSSISKATTEGLLPKDDSLPIDASNESLKDDVVLSLEAKNGDSSLISKAMAEEEEKLQAAIAKEESERDEAQEPVMNETQFSKLDELLTQTKLYSEFLLEKMEDITFVNSHDHTSFSPFMLILFCLNFYVELPCRMGWKIKKKP